MAGPTERPFVKSFAIAGVLSAIGMMAFVFVLKVPDTAHASGYLAGTMLIPAALTGFIARRSRNEWSLWKFFAVFVLFFIVTNTLSAIGRMSKQ
jgi:hypothetical protein